MMNQSVQIGKYRTRTGGSFPWSDWADFEYGRTTEEMVSINHFPLNTSIDDGGPWFLKKIIDRSQAGYMGPGVLLRYEGHFTVQKPARWLYMPGPTEPKDSELNASGTTAIARSAPTNPAFSASTLLGELAGEGLPMVVGGSLVRDRARAARAAGSEYLNAEFGWLPLLRDVRSFAKTVKRSGTILHQYRKDSGKKIRRGYSFPPTEVHKMNSDNGFLPSPALVGVNGSGTLTESAMKQTWFSGAFRYHIPVGDSTLGKFHEWMSMADHLLGVRVTPETLWNIGPWSWAADWFANTGDIMTNISNLGKDGLVLQYGYVMCTNEVRRQMTGVFAGVPCSREISEIYKRRVPATPYGFGVNLGALSPKQIAVVAALGLSKT